MAIHKFEHGGEEGDEATILLAVIAIIIIIIMTLNSIMMIWNRVFPDKNPQNDESPLTITTQQT